MGRDLALQRAWQDRFERYERSGLTIQRFCIEIILDHPVRIAVASGCDTELLAEVVRVLETR